MKNETGPSWIATSASQVKVWQECPKRWYYEKIDQKEVVPSTGAQALGSRLHAEMANWLGKGIPTTDPLLAPTFSSWLGSRAVPSPLVEHYFSVDVADTGVICRGYIDYVEMLPDGSVTVWDHKTTRSARYMKTEEELAADPQCIAYLYAARDMGNAYHFGHHYVRTDKPLPPTLVVVSKTREEIEDGWKDFVATTVLMREDATRGEPPEGNRDACWNYGGCPFQGVCSTFSGSSDFSLLFPATPRAPAKDPDPMPPGNVPIAYPLVFVDCSPAYSDMPRSFAEWAGPVIAKYKETAGAHPLVVPYQQGIRAVALAAAEEWEKAPVSLIVFSAEPIGALFASLLPSGVVVRRLG